MGIRKGTAQKAQCIWRDLEQLVYHSANALTEDESSYCQKCHDTEKEEGEERTLASLSSHPPLPPGALHLQTQPRSGDKAVPLMRSVLYLRMQSRAEKGRAEKRERPTGNNGHRHLKKISGNCRKTNMLTSLVTTDFKIKLRGTN